MASNTYVVHHCKNTTLKPADKDYCNNCFIDKDKTNVQSYAPTWKYCPECVAKGFTNKRTKAGTMSEENREKFKLRMAEYRRSKNENN